MAKEQNDQIVRLQASIAVLQSQVNFLKDKITVDDKKRDDLEQYGRRVCLRFGGIPKREGENVDCLNVVKKLWEDADVHVSDPCIDRAHWIGESYVDRKTNDNVQDIIVRLSTFRHRTLIYYARKKIKARVTLDLTKRRYNILKKAREIADKSSSIDYVFADINCQLKSRMLDGSTKKFDSVAELESLNC